MALRFVHLSDIHFGQENGELIYIHDDVRERLLDDVEIWFAHFLAEEWTELSLLGTWHSVAMFKNTKRLGSS
jgi:hypothetical protein